MANNNSTLVFILFTRLICWSVRNCMHSKVSSKLIESIWYMCVKWMAVCKWLVCHSVGANVIISYIERKWRQTNKYDKIIWTKKRISGMYSWKNKIPLQANGILFMQMRSKAQRPPHEHAVHTLNVCQFMWDH